MSLKLAWSEPEHRTRSDELSLGLHIYFQAIPVHDKCDESEVDQMAYMLKRHAIVNTSFFDLNVLK